MSTGPEQSHKFVIASTRPLLARTWLTKFCSRLICSRSWTPRHHEEGALFPWGWILRPSDPPSHTWSWPLPPGNPIHLYHKWQGIPLLDESNFFFDNERFYYLKQAITPGLCIIKMHTTVQVRSSKKIKKKVVHINDEQLCKRIGN
jgi:hypothetical protein